MRTVLHILNEEVRLDCAADELRRLEDLADALERRLAGFWGDERGYRQLATAALARARREIDRLNDSISDAAALPPDNRGRVNVLRA